MNWKIPILACLFILLAEQISGQGFYTEFGQNRIQHRNFQWQFYEGDKQRIFFHTGGQDLARYAFYKTHEYLPEIEQFFDYNLRDRTEIMLFNSLPDFRQSNLSLPDNSSESNTGGRTILRDNSSLVVFNGDYKKFDNELRTAIARGVLNEMFYGGDARERIQNAALISIPGWHKEGIVRYAGRNWNTYENEELKNMIQNGHLFSIHDLNDEQQAIAGHSFWKFLEDEFGKAAVTNVLYMISLNKNFEGGFNFVLGRSIGNLKSEWRKAMYDKYEDDEDESPQHSFDEIIDDGNPGSFSVNRDGSKASFVVHEMGRQRLYVYDFSAEEKTLIREWNYRTDKLPEDLTSPVAEWHPRRDELVVFFEKDGRLFFTIYDADEEEFEQDIAIDRLDKVLSFDIHPNGRTVILSGVNGTRTNIFSFDLNTRRTSPVTNDIYSDLHPVFVRDGDYILFSSNRVETNIEEVSSDPSEALYSPVYNIFFKDFSTRNPELKRITKGSKVNKIRPVEYDYPYFGYLTNETGAYNRNGAYLDSIFQHIRVIAKYEQENDWEDFAPKDTFLFYTKDTSAIFVPQEVLHDTALVSLDTSFVYQDYVEHYPLTNYNRSVTSYQTDQRANRVTELRYFNGQWGVYESRYPEELSAETVDRTPVSTYTQIPEIRDFWQAKIAEPAEDTVEPEEDSYYFITDFFEYDDIAEDEEVFMPEREFEEEYTRDEQTSRFNFPGSRVYSTAFSPHFFTGQLDNSVISSPYQPYNPEDNFVYDPTVNALMEVKLTDRLGHYSLRGGLGIGLDMSGTDIYAAFKNQKNKLNREYIYYRSSEASGERNNRFKMTNNELRTRMTWPFSETRSVRGDIFFRYQQQTHLSTTEETLIRGGDQQLWSGLKGEYVYDNTRSLGKNVPWGWRAKGYVELFGHLEDRSESFTVIGGDIRNYSKLYKNLILATRVAGATTLGRENLVFIMGGVENWFLPQYNDDITIDQEAGYSFKTSATQMRGFEQNIRNGSSYVLLNTELRWPVFQFFSDTRVRSEFLRDFQLILFGDGGTAWQGLTPYSDKNVVSRRVIEIPLETPEDPSMEEPKLTVISDPVREPFVWSYGAGIRTSFLGYFIKVDYGIGMEMTEEIDRTLHISMGMDF